MISSLTGGLCTPDAETTLEMEEAFIDAHMDVRTLRLACRCQGLAREVHGSNDLAVAVVVVEVAALFVGALGAAKANDRWMPDLAVAQSARSVAQTRDGRWDPLVVAADTWL